MLKIHPRPFPLVVSGPSGVGKTSICRGLQALVPEVSRVVTVTTRPPREDETRGEAYHFVDAETFDRMRSEGAFLEWAHVHTDRYGTPREEVESLLREGRIPLLNVDVQGALAIRRAMPETVLVFILPPDEATLRARLEGRGTDDAETIQVRLERAREEIGLAPRYDYVVVNDELDRCVERVRCIYRAERARARRCLDGEEG